MNPDEFEIRLSNNSSIYIKKIYSKENEIVKEFISPLLGNSGTVGIFGDWENK